VVFLNTFSEIVLKAMQNSITVAARPHVDVRAYRTHRIGVLCEREIDYVD
jgi:hypothetical protein